MLLNWEGVSEPVRRSLQAALGRKAKELFSDIAFVLAGIRAAYLLEHVAVKPVQLQPLATVLSQLIPEVFVLQLDESFLFVAHRALILANLTAELLPAPSARGDRSVLVAVDAKLTGPKVLAAAAAPELLHPSLRRIQDALREPPVTSADSPPERSSLLQLQFHGKLLPMLAGFLCEYPVILCFEDLADLSQTDNCLSMHPMAFHTWRLRSFSGPQLALPPLMKFGIPVLPTAPFAFNQSSSSGPAAQSSLESLASHAVRLLRSRLEERLRPLGYGVELETEILALPKLLL